jgi:MFS family permease
MWRFRRLAPAWLGRTFVATASAGGASGASAPRGSYLELLRRNSAFKRLFVGQVISYCGDWFLTVALLDLVLRLTHSAALAALMIVCQTLPSFLLAPLAGSVVDKHDRRKLVVGIACAQTLLALLPIMAHTTALLPIAYLGVIGIASGATFVSPAIQSSIPNIVTDDDLVMANVLMGSTWGAMLAVGSALGGVIVAIGGLGVSCIVDSATFAAAAMLLWSIRVPFQEVRVHEALPFIESAREALSYARQRPRVLALLTCKGGFGIGAGAVVLLSVFGRDVFHDGSLGIGILYGARGVGALVGPFLVRRVAEDDNAKFRLIGWCGILYGVGYCGFALSPVVGIAGLAITVAHLGGGAQWMVSSYGLQREVPDALRGRIFAADFGMVTLTTSVSTLGAGILADTAGPIPTALIGGALMLAWGVIWAAWTRPLWRAAPATATG